MRTGARRAAAEQLPLVAYIHPWEAGPEQPRLHVRAGYRLRLYTNLARIYDRLAALRAFGEFSSFAECGLEEHAPLVTDLTRDAMTTQDNMPQVSLRAAAVRDGSRVDSQRERDEHGGLE